MRLCLISDTHGKYRDLVLPEADILIHAGDWTAGGSKQETHEFFDWMDMLPFKRKILTGGNHDGCMAVHNAWLCLQRYFPKVDYLCDNGVEVDGLKFWGSPWTPAFMNWYFMYHTPAEARSHWDLIPSDTDVLITHGPPFGALDTVQAGGKHLGCMELDIAMKRLIPRYPQDDVTRKLHVFGHIHGGHGTRDSEVGIQYVNASVMDEAYRVVNKPVVVDWDGERFTVVK